MHISRAHSFPWKILLNFADQIKNCPNSVAHCGLRSLGWLPFSYWRLALCEVTVINNILTFLLKTVIKLTGEGRHLSDWWTEWWPIFVKCVCYSVLTCFGSTTTEAFQWKSKWNKIKTTHLNVCNITSVKSVETTHAVWLQNTEQYTLKLSLGRLWCSRDRIDPYFENEHTTSTETTGSMTSAFASTVSFCSLSSTACQLLLFCN